MNFRPDMNSSPNVKGKPSQEQFNQQSRQNKKKISSREYSNPNETFDEFKARRHVTDTYKQDPNNDLLKMVNETYLDDVLADIDKKTELKRKQGGASNGAFNEFKNGTYATDAYKQDPNNDLLKMVSETYLDDVLADIDRKAELKRKQNEFQEILKQQEALKKERAARAEEFKNSNAKYGRASSSAHNRNDSQQEEQKGGDFNFAKKGNVNNGLESESVESQVIRELGIDKSDLDLIQSVLVKPTPNELTLLAKKVFGVEDGSDKMAIKSAYRKLSSLLHPDKSDNKNDPIKAEKFKIVNALYDKCRG